LALYGDVGGSIRVVIDHWFLNELQRNVRGWRVEVRNCAHGIDETNSTHTKAIEVFPLEILTRAVCEIDDHASLKTLVELVGARVQTTRLQYIDRLILSSLSELKHLDAGENVVTFLRIELGFCESSALSSWGLFGPIPQIVPAQQHVTMFGSDFGEDGNLQGGRARTRLRQTHAVNTLKPDGILIKASYHLSRRSSSIFR
jgi:hypothetical protein